MVQLLMVVAVEWVMPYEMALECSFCSSSATPKNKLQEIIQCLPCTHCCHISVKIHNTHLSVKSRNGNKGIHNIGEDISIRWGVGIPVTEASYWINHLNPIN